MASLILIANDHMLIWLPVPGEGGRQPVEALLEWVCDPQWRLPETVYRQFFVPARITLEVHRQGQTVVLRPNRPLRERRPTRELTADQREVLRRMAAGQTADQIAFALSRQRRWVCYQIAEIRRRLGVTTRAAALRSRRI
jgi:DNA-binding NarL/FixJ family response regulator